MRFRPAPGVLFASLVVAMTMATSASAQGFSINILFDENCNGRLTNTAGFDNPLACSFRADPGPGGFASVMFYNLQNPPSLVGGDVQVMESGGTLSDLLRFDVVLGGVFVYSDLDGGIPDALADIGLPSAFNTNLVSLPEVGPEGNNGAVYTPTAGQPGFVGGAAGPVTYSFTSDSAPIVIVPEPAAVGLLLAGGAVLALRRVRTRAA